MITLEDAVRVLSTNPCTRFGLPLGQDYSVWDLNACYTVDPADFVSMGKASPFTGMEVFGKCMMTVCGGNVVWAAE